MWGFGPGQAQRGSNWDATRPYERRCVLIVIVHVSDYTGNKLAHECLGGVEAVLCIAKNLSIPDVLCSENDDSVGTTAFCVSVKKYPLSTQ